MRQPPSNTIAKKAVTAWKITAALYMLIPMGISIAGLIVTAYFELPYLYAAIVIAISILVIYLSVFVIPTIRWRRFRYQVFDQEIYIQRGIFIETRTLIPMIRVQHVDTKQGPILKKFGLASLTVSTAATTHEIPALQDEEAALLRDQISELARVDHDDF